LRGRYWLPVWALPNKRAALEFIDHGPPSNRRPIKGAAARSKARGRGGQDVVNEQFRNHGSRPFSGGRMTDIKVTLVVACALVDADKRVLLAQRPEGKALSGLWEFPGGKIEPGERPEQTLIRELHEEIGITVSEPCLAPLTFASHAYETFHLLMPLYICRRWEGLAVAREGQNLAWVRANKLRDYPMPPADLPLIPHLVDLLM
jgi:8-oxo-dGTP diphosphatase